MCKTSDYDYDNDNELAVSSVNVAGNKSLNAAKEYSNRIVGKSLKNRPNRRIKSIPDNTPQGRVLNPWRVEDAREIRFRNENWIVGKEETLPRRPATDRVSALGQQHCSNSSRFPAPLHLQENTQMALIRSSDRPHSEKNIINITSRRLMQKIVTLTLFLTPNRINYLRPECFYPSLKNNPEVSLYVSYNFILTMVKK